MRFTILALTLALVLVSTTAYAAKPLPGFYEGPYLRFLGGFIYTNFDTNIRTGAPNADKYEGTIGFHFGWNIWDCAAPELEVIYTAGKINDMRQHKVLAALNFKYTFLADALMFSENFQILPYVKLGPAGFVGVVPGDPLATQRTMTAWSAGFGGGGGVDFLIKKYLYTGIGFQAAGLYMPAVYQDLVGVRTKILAGGWMPVFSLLASIGVHF